MECFLQGINRFFEIFKNPSAFASFDHPIYSNYVSMLFGHEYYHGLPPIAFVLLVGYQLQNLKMSPASSKAAQLGRGLSFVAAVHAAFLFAVIVQEGIYCLSFLFYTKLTPCERRPVYPPVYWKARPSDPDYTCVIGPHELALIFTSVLLMSYVSTCVKPRSVAGWLVDAYACVCSIKWYFAKNELMNYATLRYRRVLTAVSARCVVLKDYTASVFKDETDNIEVDTC